jgi:hypothetical protein
LVVFNLHTKWEGVMTKASCRTCKKTVKEGAPATTRDSLLICNFTREHQKRGAEICNDKSEGHLNCNGAKRARVKVRITPQLRVKNRITEALT